MATSSHDLDLAAPPAAMLEPGIDYEYPGGKGAEGTWQWLVSLMPTHSIYVEPFAGKGGLLRRKPPALRSYVFDRDATVIGWWARLAWPGVTATVADGIRWLDENAGRLPADVLIYCDPPYLRQTRSKKRIYAFELSDKQHQRMLGALVRASCDVMLSGYPSAMYDEALGSWQRHERRAWTRGRTFRTEVCWCNFAHDRLSPVGPMVYSGYGKNFRERERVAKKIKRWTAMLQAMPLGERRALVLSILQEANLFKTVQI